MKLKLRSIKDGKDSNRWCGTAVVSAVTKLTTGEAARLIRIQSNKKMVTGTTSRQIHMAMNACNIKMVSHRASVYGEEARFSRSNGITLARWLKLSVRHRTEGKVFLISAGRHWQLISGRRYTCGRIREIVSIRDKRIKRRSKVRAVYELISDNVTKPDFDVSKPKYVDVFASTKAKARRLAKKIGAEIEKSDHDSDYIYVSPPPIWEYMVDPLDLDTNGYGVCGWEEVLSRLEEFKEIIDKTLNR